MAFWIHAWARDWPERVGAPGQRLAHTAGDGFCDLPVAPGDRIYVVGFSGNQMLFLLGGLTVAAVGEHVPGGDATSAFYSAIEAAQVFEQSPEELWPSKAHFVAKNLRGSKLQAHGDPFTPADHEQIILLDATGKSYPTPVTPFGTFETGIYQSPQRIDRHTAMLLHRLLDWT